MNERTKNAIVAGFVAGTVMTAASSLVAYFTNRWVHKAQKEEK